uniref:Glutathione synthetase n=1 Tax=Cacopsylla melanoneura TaxID=428564 RepID=A0A8D9EKN9_9HEMI
MSSKLNSVVETPIPDHVLEALVPKAKDYALMHGAGMRSKTNFSQDGLIVAPFALLPSTFPRVEFEKAVNIQTVLNELVHRVAHDYSFLKETLKNACEVDDFTKNLFKIYETVQKEGVAQATSFGLFRADYLLDSDHAKQVEVNTIASSFAGIAQQVPTFHRYVLTELGHHEKIKNLPENRALSGLCEGMIEAWTLFNDPKAIILFLIEDVTYNICDQRFHEFELKRLNPHIRVIRQTLTQIGTSARLSEDKTLLVEGAPVAVVYFRAGYTPDHYFGQVEWDARLIIERSTAIKCPSIHYHLAGAKKIQQALASEGVLEKFLTNPNQVQQVRDIFTGLWSLDYDTKGDDAVEMALKNPAKFVLKPQREGGGNNVYGEHIAKALLSMAGTQERSAWILMEKIIPPVQSNYLIRAGSEIHCSDIVSELGIYGVIIGDENRVISNRQVGHMLRSKAATADEGGVAGGAGALDSPYLV